MTFGTTEPRDTDEETPLVYRALEGVALQEEGFEFTEDGERWLYEQMLAGRD